MPGQLWVDPYSNLSLRVVSANSTSLAIEVNYGAVPCAPANPAVTLAPSALSVLQGNSGTFTVTVNNQDNGGCSPRTFNLSAAAPAGWNSVFGVTALTINPGQSAQTTLTVTAPAGQSVGTYPISATATNGSSTGTSNANVTVTEPTYALNETISGRGKVMLDPPGAVCSASCTQQYPQAANQLVTLSAQANNGQSFQGWSGACSGTATTCAVTMDASKTVSAKFGKKR